MKDVTLGPALGELRREAAEHPDSATAHLRLGTALLKTSLLDEAVAALESLPSGTRKILLTPQGRPFDQAAAVRLAGEERLALFCGRYEGFDERIRAYVDEEISLGDFVLQGGEVAAMAIVEAVVRLLPGVLHNADSPREESFAGGLLEYPQYTRPEIVNGERVPEILLSGDHAKVARWRRGQALLRTKRKRPELLARLALAEEDLLLLAEAEAG